MRVLKKVPADRRSEYVQRVQVWRREHEVAVQDGKKPTLYAKMEDTSGRGIADTPRLFSRMLFDPEQLPDMVLVRYAAFASLADRREFLLARPDAERCPNPDTGEKLELETA